MREIKREKVAEIIHHLAAEFAHNEESGASLLTITRVVLSPTGKEAQVFFTTLPEKQEDTALKFLTRKIPEFKRYIRDESRLGLIPHVTFKIDYGERNRQRLDELSENL
jgi:ribosome-binding factor A